MSNTDSAVEDRALTLLGHGIDPKLVASAVGVSVSRISQLVSDPVFADKVSDLRYKYLSRHNERDNAYDEIESELIERMKGLLPMMYKPMEVLKAIAVINGAARRGASSPESILGQKEVVSLTMPAVIINQFTKNDLTVNINNQVVRAGDQELVTVQSVRMQDLLRQKNGQALLDRQAIIQERVGNLLDEKTRQREERENYEHVNASAAGGSPERSSAHEERAGNHGSA